MLTDLKKARNGVIAAALGAALLMGGGTYALWTTSATSGGGSITAGNMTIDAKEVLAFDTSPDQIHGTAVDIEVGDLTLGSGVGIDLKAFRMVPGDTVALVFSYDITLEGDNLMADLTLGGVDVTDAKTFLDLTYDLYDITGDPVVTDGTLPDSSAMLTTLTAPENGSVVLVIHATFKSETENTDGAGNALLDLANSVGMTLEQVRPATP